MSFSEFRKDEPGYPILPLEAGRPRVQRLITELAPVHLELEPPTAANWTLTVEGSVDSKRTFSLSDLVLLGVSDYVADFHCVWGWSKPRVRWAGVPASAVFDATGVAGGATHVRFSAQDSPYASCVSIDEARDGLFALELDDEPLDPINGGPLRWLQPHYLWGYKGVKWVCGAKLIDHVDAGPWESKVGDVAGRVPGGIVELFEQLEQGECDARP